MTIYRSDTETHRMLEETQHFKMRAKVSDTCALAICQDLLDRGMSIDAAKPGKEWLIVARVSRLRVRLGPADPPTPLFDHDD